MKVYIAVDMPGISGIVDLSQGWVSGVDYSIGRQLMTKEAAAAATGAFEANAQEVVVSDAHESNGYRNILIEELPEDAWLISGDERPMGPIEGLHEGFDALALIGYHARHGNEGVLDSTMEPNAIFDIRVNGQSMGHIGLAAMVAGHFDIPVVLVTGDDSAVREAQAILPNTHVLCVKESIGRHAARSIHPQKARDQIRQTIKEALEARDDISPFKIKSPVNVAITFKYTSMADRASQVPGVKRLEGIRAGFEAENPAAAYRRLETAVQYASSAIAANKLI